MAVWNLRCRRKGVSSARGVAGDGQAGCEPPHTTHTVVHQPPVRVGHRRRPTHRTDRAGPGARRRTCRVRWSVLWPDGLVLGGGGDLASSGAGFPGRVAWMPSAGEEALVPGLIRRTSSS